MMLGRVSFHSKVKEGLVSLCRVKGYGQVGGLKLVPPAKHSE